MLELEDVVVVADWALDLPLKAEEVGLETDFRLIAVGDFATIIVVCHISFSLQNEIDNVCSINEIKTKHKKMQKLNR